MGSGQLWQYHANIHAGLLNLLSLNVFSEVKIVKKCVGGRGCARTPLGELIAFPDPLTGLRMKGGPGTGKFSDDVEMTVEYSRSGPAGRTSVAGLGGAYRGGRPPTACLLRP